MPPNSNSENVRKRNRKLSNDNSVNNHNGNNHHHHHNNRNGYCDKNDQHYLKNGNHSAVDGKKEAKQNSDNEEKLLFSIGKQKQQSKKKFSQTNICVENNNKISISKLIKDFLISTAVLLLIFSLTFFYLPWKKWILNDIEINDYLANTTFTPAIDDEQDGEYHIFLATTEQHLSEAVLHEVNCSEKGYWREREINAEPGRCGTLIYDELVSEKEALQLRRIAATLINEIGDSSSQIRESFNLKWLNLHNAFRKGPRKNIFTEKDFDLIKKTGNKAKALIASIFGIPDEILLFSNVSQFTRYRPVTEFSEFRHVDKVRSPSLIFTSILWLSTVDVDFIGGRTEFLTGGPEPFTPLLIDPKIGRFAAWTSSYENPHAVLELYEGERLALIFGFTVSSVIGHQSIDDLRRSTIASEELYIN